MVAKDTKPTVNHPHVTSACNLHVIKSLASLKSRGYVREQFAWRHYYWFLTNEGIEYLRQRLHLPTECVPATLSRRQAGGGAGAVGGDPRGSQQQQKPLSAERLAYRKAPTTSAAPAAAADAN